MLKYSILLLSLLILSMAYGQRGNSLPWVSGDVVNDSCYIRVKASITKTTGYEFSKHPLLWAKEQIESNLLKTDTLFNDSLKRRTIYYYAKQGNLIQIVTLPSQEGEKWESTKVFDEQNNLTFWERLYSRNTVMRIRRGYDDANRLVFECTFWETPIRRLKIYKEGKTVLYEKPVCNCDF